MLFRKKTKKEIDEAKRLKELRKMKPNQIVGMTSVIVFVFFLVFFVGMVCFSIGIDKGIRGDFGNDSIWYGKYDGYGGKYDYGNGYDKGYTAADYGLDKAIKAYDSWRGMSNTKK